MPFGKGDTFYLFHQRDTRKPCPFGEPFGWDLATTKDFVTYEDYLPEVFVRIGMVFIMHFIPVLIVTIQNRGNRHRC